MKIKRILLTGVSVLAISALSNCFLTDWLGDALDPYGSVDGAKALELIQKAASDGYSMAGLTYTSKKTKVTLATEEVSVNTVTSDKEPTPGFAQMQVAFVKEITKMAANIDPGHNYTAASVKNCISAVQAASFAVAYSQIESTDKETADCITGTKTFADKKFSEVIRGSCYLGSTYTAPAAGAAALTSTGATCLGCMITVANIAAGEGPIAGANTTGNGYYATNVVGASASSNGDIATNAIIPWITTMRSLFGQVNKLAAANGGNSMQSSKDSCMEFYMAAIGAGTTLKKCAKIQGAGGLAKATTLTGFIGGTSCELEKTGYVVSTPWLNL